jgi:branched-chain amino acid transport system ATP-binding protein
VRDEGLAAIIVEQHAHKVLGITDEALVLERGRVAHLGPSQALLTDSAALGRLLAVG